MRDLMFIILYFVVHAVKCSPVVFKDSSPDGETVISISSSDPEIEKYFTFGRNLDSKADNSKNIPENLFDRSFSFVGPGKVIAGSGRGFATVSSVNPFSIPMFFMPLNVEGLDLGNLGLDWIRNIQGIFDPSLIGNGEVKTVAAVNNNGRVFSKVSTVKYSDKDKRYVEV